MDLQSILDAATVNTGEQFRDKIKIKNLKEKIDSYPEEAEVRFSSALANIAGDIISGNILNYGLKEKMNDSLKTKLMDYLKSEVYKLINKCKPEEQKPEDEGQKAEITVVTSTTEE